ncbi:MAG: glycosyltransferase family 4 protein [Akkermansiaceae bacterium]|nr:glycosyltransferase family 4 protein [Akkermansiaceae bacterium]
MKALLFANTDWYLLNFRRGLLEALRESGVEVCLACPPGDYTGQLEDLGFRAVPLAFDRGSLGPVSNLRLLRDATRVVKREQPDIVHNFTPKCVLSGGAAARRHGVPCINAVTGLGHLFIDDRPAIRAARRLARPVYRYACGGPRCRVIFQNSEDRDLFVSEKLVEESRTALIRGSGADCGRFVPPEGPRRGGPCRLLFASRLLKEKGIHELLEAAGALRSRGVEFELTVAGDPDPGNPSSMTEEEIAAATQTGLARFVGHSDDLLPLLQDADLVVLPSYREGTPKILLEAGACGKAMVATEIAGCRGVVVPGVNGELVPPRDARALAAALEKLVADPGLQQEYGRGSREIVVREFSEEIVVNRTLEVYSALLPGFRVPSRSASGAS